MSKTSYVRTSSGRKFLIEEPTEDQPNIPSESITENERQKDWQAYCQLADAFATLQEFSDYLPKRVAEMIDDAFCQYQYEAQWQLHPRTMRLVLPALFALRDEKHGYEGEPENRTVTDAEIDAVRAVFLRRR